MESLFINNSFLNEFTLPFSLVLSYKMIENLIWNPALLSLTALCLEVRSRKVALSSSNELCHSQTVGFPIHLNDETVSQSMNE